MFGIYWIIKHVRFSDKMVRDRAKSTVFITSSDFMQQTMIKQNFIGILWAQAKGIVDVRQRWKWKIGIWNKTNKGTCKEAFRAKLFTSRIYGLDTETFCSFSAKAQLRGRLRLNLREIEFLSDLIWGVTKVEMGLLLFKVARGTPSRKNYKEIVPDYWDFE